MKTAPESPAARFEIEGRARSAVFWLSLSLLAAVPLAFSRAVHRMFSLPKFAILIVGSSAQAALSVAAAEERNESAPARADEDPSKQTVDELLARGRERRDQGKTKKARKKLLRVGSADVSRQRSFRGRISRNRLLAAGS